MNIVKEHIDFKRGLDPKDAMNTGDPIARLQMQYVELLDGIEELRIRQQFNVDVITRIPDRFLRKCGWGNVWKFFDELSPEELNDFKEIIHKYTKKHLKENINFQRGLDPRDAMQTGIRTKIIQWLEDHYHNISTATKQSRYKINDDLTIDIKGFFTTDWDGNFPDYIQFNEVHGNFQIGGTNTNRNKMTSLRGCPRIVKGNFECCRQQLKNLIGGPEEVHGTYLCGINPLESLEGLAKVITGYVACNNKSGLTKKDIPKGTKIGEPNKCNIHYWGYT